MKHIRIFHNTKSNYEFDLKYRLIDQKWRTWKLTKFSNYFQKQWVNSKIGNFFLPPIGHATTNSTPIGHAN